MLVYYIVSSCISILHFASDNQLAILCMRLELEREDIHEVWRVLGRSFGESQLGHDGCLLPDLRRCSRAVM